MKSKIILTIFVVLVLVLGVFLVISEENAIVETPNNATENVIRYTNDGFEPETLTVPVGTEVTFVNDSDFQMWPASDSHPSHLILPEFDPKEAIPSGGNWFFVFNQEGSWGFHDHIRSQRTGTIVVE